MVQESVSINSEVETLAPRWSTDVAEAPLPVVVQNGIVYRALKRAFDFATALTGLLISLPLWPIIAVATKLTSKGPVLFLQKRPGRNGVPFTLLKFRTMCEDAEARIAEVMHLNQNEEPGPVHIADDPRITRTGMLLRKTSLDELPQLINVLKGEMSIVGPRPLIEPMRDPRARARLAVTPGLTGLWQIRRRHNDSTEFLLSCDMEYLETRSVWVDLKIMLQTPFAMLRRDGYR